MMKRIELLLLLLFSFFLFLPETYAAVIRPPVYYCETRIEAPGICQPEDWEIPSGWKSTVSILHTPRFQADSNYVWYAFPLQDGDPVSHTLFFSTMNESVEVIYDGKKIYGYGKLDDVLGNNGMRWHLITLPNDRGIHWVRIGLYTPIHSQLGTFNYFSLDSESKQAQRIFLYDAVNVIALSIAIGMLVIMALFLWEDTMNSKIYLASVFFLLTFIIAIIGAANTKYIVVWNASAWWYCLNMMAFFLPVSANCLAYTVFRGEGQKYASFLTKVILLACVLFFFGDMAGFHISAHYITAYLIFLFISELGILGFDIIESWRGNYFARGLIFPAVSFYFFAVLDAMGMMFHLFPWHVNLMPLGIFGFILFVLFILREQVQREHNAQARTENLKSEIEKSITKATTDKLTGCLNRTSFHDLLDGACRDAVEKQLPLSLIMLDIDHFKRFNDTYGHDSGDSVLKNFSACIRETLKENQPLIRWGGEEFVIICPGLPLREAAKQAEELRYHISESKIHDKEHVTSSVGVSSWHGASDTAQDLFRRMDESLYYAKEHGRNRVMTEEILS